MHFSVSSFPPHVFWFWVKLIDEIIRLASLWGCQSCSTAAITQLELSSGECSSSLLQNRITQLRWGGQWALNLFLIGCWGGSQWENRCYFHSLCCRLLGKTTTPKKPTMSFSPKSNFKGSESLVQVPWGHVVDNWFWQERRSFLGFFSNSPWYLSVHPYHWVLFLQASPVLQTH